MIKIAVPVRANRTKNDNRIVQGTRVARINAALGVLIQPVNSTKLNLPLHEIEGQIYQPRDKDSNLVTLVKKQQEAYNIFENATLFFLPNKTPAV